MSALLGKEWVVFPIVAALAFFIAYLWADRAVDWLHRRSLGQREEVLRFLELMFVKTDRRRVTLMLVSSSFGLGLLIFIALWPNIAPGLILGSVVTVAMWSVPTLIVKAQYEKRCSAFVDQMVDGMTLMSNGISAGLSVQQCLERVEEAMPNPMSQEFGLVLAQMRLGRGLSEALNELATRIPRPDVQMFVLAVNILNETGGKMSETFQTITYTVRERQKIEKKIDAMTAQGVTQGVILTSVPFFLLILFWFVNPAYVEPLFNTIPGLMALALMLTLQIVGGLAIRKIVKINV